MKANIIYKTLLALAAPMLFAACGNDADVEAPVITEEFEGFTLSVPLTRGADTKAAEEKEADDNEGYIKDLFIVAYPQGTTAATNFKTFDYTLNSGDYTSTSANVAGTKYAEVPFVLPVGTYHIYVFANVVKDNIKKSDGSAITIDKDSETDLKSAIITGLTPIKASDLSGESRKYIPMSCHNDVLQTEPGYSGKEFPNKTVTIAKGKATKIYANMTFAMAKVRFTLINDKVASLDVPTKFDLTKSAKNVSLLSTINASGNALADAALVSGGTKKACPTGTFNSDSDAEGANVENLPDYTSGDKWAWQGTWYIPERIYATGETAKSAFDFYFTDTDEAYNKATTLDDNFVRSHYYDYVAYIQKKIVTVKVRVKEWNYYKADIIDLE